MQYFGGKTKVSNQIVNYLESVRKENQVYVEPFVGGGIICSKMSGERKAYDFNEYLIEMYKEVQNGYELPNRVSEEEYKYIREHKNEDKALTGFVGFGCSFADKWFGGYAGIVHTKIGTDRNYYDEAVRNVLKQRNKILDVIYGCKSYEEISIKGAVIYCDPPYVGTTKYKDDFDHWRYWDWIRDMSRNNIVFCSEYNAPDDFECIWTKELTTTLDKASRSKAVERLFKYKG